MDINLTIQHMVERYAEKAPDHTAIIAEDSSICYRELNQKANQLAHYLQKSGLHQDTLIAISLDRSLHLMIGLLGILKAGCAYLPLDANHPKHRLQYILEESKAPVLITQSKSKDKFNDYSGQVIFMDQDGHKIDSEQRDNPSYACSSENLAYVIYTSGSTGKPKGVLIEHKSVLNYIKWFNDYSANRQQSRVDFSSNVIFDMAVTTSITALALGLQVVICSDEVKKDVRQYLLFLQQNKINITKLTPSYFKILIEEARHKNLALPNLKTIILGGEGLMTKDCIAWLKRYPKHILFNEYGPTETTVAVSAFKITQKNISQLGKSVPIGKPGFNIDCMLVNENKPIESAGVIGELYVGGICLARGYLNQEELTSKQFSHHSLHHQEHNSNTKLYKTGDYCRYLPDGNIEFINRIDDQVKIRGYKIELAEIETCLASYPQIKEVCVQARSTPSGEKQLIAYYIANDLDQPHDKIELRKFLQQSLTDYMIPTTFIMMKAFPLTENGKLDTKSLPEPIFEHEIMKPETPIESQLVEIWKNIFHLKNIGINSHFFELGGHSLMATRIVSEIEKSMRKKIQLKDLYNSPTISELARIITVASNCDKLPKKDNITLNNKGNFPLGDFQLMFWLANLVDPKIKEINVIARRRVQGRLDNDRLTHAFNWIFKKHEVLSYRIAKYLPAQYLKNDITFHIIENDLTNNTKSETETKLCASLHELNTISAWHNKMPSILVKLFHLPHEISEIQICVPHFLFDDASEKILFNELSSAYIDRKNASKFPSEAFTQYKDYVLYERSHINQNLKRDIKFWEEYLQDTHQVIVPKNEIIRKMGNNHYSLYHDMPDEVINNAQRICAKNSLNIADLVCASVALTLKKETSQLNNNIFMNIIRSVRDNEIHDQMIGCFLRLDPIKVNIHTNLQLIELAKTIQQSRLDTEPYQACSGMVKLAALNKNCRKKSFKEFMIHIFCSAYSLLFSKLQINPTMLMMYSRLNSLRRKRQFLVNINLLNNFVSTTNDQHLFGLKLEEVNTYLYDLSNIDNVLDICILKNESSNQTYLVISGNLKASFRQQIGDEMINLLGSADNDLGSVDHSLACGKKP